MSLQLFACQTHSRPSVELFWALSIFDHRLVNLLSSPCALRSTGCGEDIAASLLLLYFSIDFNIYTDDSSNSSVIEILNATKSFNLLLSMMKLENARLPTLQECRVASTLIQHYHHSVSIRTLNCCYPNTYPNMWSSSRVDPWTYPILFIHVTIWPLA